MGTRHIAWAFHEVVNIPSPVKFVLACLAEFANHDGECWPSVPSIMKATSLGESTVRRNIGLLVQWGAMRKEERAEKGRTQSNKYFLNLEWSGLETENSEESEGSRSETPPGAGPQGSRSGTVTTLSLPLEPEEEESARTDLENQFQTLIDVFQPGPTEDLALGRKALRELQAFERSSALKHAARFMEAMREEKRKRCSIAHYLRGKRWEATALYGGQVAKAVTHKPTVFVAKDSPGWLAWAKFLGKSPFGMSVSHSSEHRADGWWFTSAMPPAMVT